MKQCLVSEDKLPQKLSVITSPKISKQIEVIDNYNQNDIDALSQWNEYIEGLKSYISNPVIAWDYNNKYPRFPNGAIHLEELGYDVTFIVKTSNRTNSNYVYVFMLNLKPEEFGLKVPPKGNYQSQVNNQANRNIAHNISVDNNGNYVSAYGHGADFVSESMRNKNINYNRNMNKKLIRLTESDLHRIVKESVNKTLNEDMGVKDTVNKVDKAYRLVREACQLLEVVYNRTINSGGPYVNPFGKKVMPVKEELNRICDKLDYLADEAERSIVFF